MSRVERMTVGVAVPALIAATVACQSRSGGRLGGRASASAWGSPGASALEQVALAMKQSVAQLNASLVAAEYLARNS